MPKWAVLYCHGANRLYLHVYVSFTKEKVNVDILVFIEFEVVNFIDSSVLNVLLSFKILFLSHLKWLMSATKLTISLHVNQLEIPLKWALPRIRGPLNTIWRINGKTDTLENIYISLLPCTTISYLVICNLPKWHHNLFSTQKINIFLLK